MVAADKSTLSSSIRRTASLDALYMRPSWNMAHHLQLQQQLQSQRQVAAYTILQLDKATQTEGTYVDDTTAAMIAAAGTTLSTSTTTSNTDLSLSPSNNEYNKFGKVIRERLQGMPSPRAGEHSVSSQTLSPVHGKSIFYFYFFCVFFFGLIDILLSLSLDCVWAFDVIKRTHLILQLINFYLL